MMKMMETNSSSYESRSQGQTARISPQLARLWRLAAQRNLRNQWSKLDSLRTDWRAAVSEGRSHATSVVNCYLSQKYMDGMDFGVLSDMPNIQTKSCDKLFKQQELYRGKLLSSYKEMEAVVTRMVNVCKNMRCYCRGTTSSPLAQFSNSSVDGHDSGDGGGISVCTFWSIPAFEELAWELVRMFISELRLKRLLVTELLSISNEEVVEISGFHWSGEFYEGKFDDLSICSSFSKETQEPVIPSLDSSRPGASLIQYKQQPDSNVLQVYITTWLVEVNIDRRRVDEILGIVGEEMHVDFLEK